MKKFKTFLILTLLMVIPLAASEINFRSDTPIDSYNNLNMQGNILKNISEESGNTNEAVPQSFISNNYLNRVNPSVDGNLTLTNDGNIALSGGYLSNDGRSKGVRVKDNGNVKIPDGNLNLSNNEITNLPPPQTNLQPIRKQEASDYLNRTGDMMDGNLSFNNQYYINRLKDPNNAQDAATKNYVDNNDKNTQLAESDVEDYVFDNGDNTGNLGLNGGEIQDNSGPITLGGGNVEITGGNLDLKNNKLKTGDWSNASGLDSQGNPNDFKNADDLDSAGDVTSLSDVNTGDLTEGSNEYHTDERVQDAAANAITGSGATTVTYNDGSNQIDISSTDNVDDNVEGAELDNLFSSNGFIERTSSNTYSTTSTLSDSSVTDSLTIGSGGDINGNALSSDTTIDTGSDSISVNTGNINHNNLNNAADSDAHHTKTTDTNTQLDSTGASSNVNMNHNEIQNVVIDKRDCSSNTPTNVGQIVYCTNADN